MVKYQKDLDLLFSSLADPTRREILQRIAENPPSRKASEGQGGLTVSEIAKPYDMSLPAVSKHLKVLEKAKLIERTKTGREYIFAFNPRPLEGAAKYIAFYKKFWSKQFDRLEKYLENSSKAKPAYVNTTARRRR